MRAVRFPSPATKDTIVQTFNRAMAIIAAASNIDALRIAQTYTVKNYTPTRTLDVSTATLAEVAAFLATLIGDLQAQGAANG